MPWIFETDAVAPWSSLPDCVSILAKASPLLRGPMVPVDSIGINLIIGGFGPKLAFFFTSLVQRRAGPRICRTKEHHMSQDYSRVLTGLTASVPADLPTCTTEEWYVGSHVFWWQTPIGYFVWPNGMAFLLLQ